ncbi:MAG: hypothetical protein KA066_00085 [Candidatus Pacebacteria bacterium]|nr:hypothetical protein [Candidatus Paceibacterota bacterium]
MELAGELLSLVVSLSQQIAIVAGVGAVTMTLVGHLLSLHAHQNEMVHGYMRAARSIRALALMVIIVSGGAAVLVHFQQGTSEVLLAPAYLFKWLLIVLLTAFYFVELKVEGVARDAVEGFEGANWYALFIVHSIAPVVTWMFLLSLYFGWLATFAVIWAGFVWLMRRQTTISPAGVQKPNASAPKPAPVPPLPAKPAPVPPPVPVRAVPPPAPKPMPAPAPIVQKPIEIHPNHSMLPMIAELDLPAPSKVEVPASKPVQPAPAPVAPPKPVAKVEIVPESSKPPVAMSNLEESGLAALHVMPKRPEDIESSKRGPVVKMSDE